MSLPTEINYFEKSDLSLINKLRTETAPTNTYLSFYFEETMPKCLICDNYDTVDHFIQDCLIYDSQQHNLLLQLQKVQPQFLQRSNFNTLNILFPYRLRCPPRKDDPLFDVLIQKQKYQRLECIQALINFVKETKKIDID